MVERKGLMIRDRWLLSDGRGRIASAVRVIRRWSRSSHRGQRQSKTLEDGEEERKESGGTQDCMNTQGGQEY